MGAVGAGGTGGISIMIERESRMKSESRGGREGESGGGGSVEIHVKHLFGGERRRDQE